MDIDFKNPRTISNSIRRIFDYVFCENGMVAYKGKNLIGKKIISQEIGRVKSSKITLNFVLKIFQN